PLGSPRTALSHEPQCSFHPSLASFPPTPPLWPKFDDDNESLYTSDDSNYEYELASPTMAKHLSWKKLSVLSSTVGRTQLTQLSQLVNWKSCSSTSTTSDSNSALDNILHFYRDTPELAIQDEVPMYENELPSGDVWWISEGLSVLDEYLNADEAFLAESSLVETHAVALNQAVDEFLRSSLIRVLANVRRLTKELPQ
ncbi:hypothetical protein IWQ61_009105, partial [Dispira simplex]